MNERLSRLESFLYGSQKNEGKAINAIGNESIRAEDSAIAGGEACSVAFRDNDDEDGAEGTDGEVKPSDGA